MSAPARVAADPLAYLSRAVDGCVEKVLRVNFPNVGRCWGLVLCGGSRSARNAGPGTGPG